jgi:hypothetical protein
VPLSRNLGTSDCIFYTKTIHSISIFTRKPSIPFPFLHENHPFHTVIKRPWPLTGAIGAVVTLIGLIKWFYQYDDSLPGIGAITAVLTIIQWWWDVNPGRITYKNSNKRHTMRNNSIHCLRNRILLSILLSILSYKTITNIWSRINLTTYRNSSGLICI